MSTENTQGVEDFGGAKFRGFCG